MKKDYAEPYPELPFPWTVTRINGEVSDYFYGYNIQTGERTASRLTYAAARSEIYGRIKASGKRFPNFF